MHNFKYVKMNIVFYRRKGKLRGHTNTNLELRVRKSV